MARRSENTLELLLLIGGGGYLAYKYLLPNVPAITAAVVNPVATGVAIGSNLARGIRNNNPGNIVYNVLNQWRGQVGSDGRFAKFSDAVYGLRAMFVLLRRYVNDYRLDTIAKIASRWAPPNENNTSAYASNVANMSGIAINAKINPNNFAQMAALAKGIIGAENGRSQIARYDGIMSQAWGLL